MKKVKILKKKAAAKSFKKAKKRATVVSISKDSREENLIRITLQKIARNARQRAFRKNISVTIVQDDKIVRIYPSGARKVIGKIRKKSSRVDPKQSISLN